MKISCPICFEQVDAESASSIQKCPNCNNDLPVPEASAGAMESSQSGSESSSKARAVSKDSSPARDSSLAKNAASSSSAAVDTTRNEADEKKFSFRIMGISLLLMLLIVLSGLIVALSVLFALKNVESEIVLGFRDVFFDRLGITDPSQYDTQKMAFAIGQFSLPMIFGICESLISR